MNKILAYLGTAAAIGMVALFTLSAPSKSTTLEDALHASVQLENYCSGTVIADPDLSDGEQFTVISAKHCLDAEQGIGTVLTINIPVILGNEYTKDQTPVKMIVKDVSKESDLILLQGMKPSDNPHLPQIGIYGGTPTIGTPTYAFGYPRAESLTVTYGLLGYIISMGEMPELSKSGLWQKSGTAVQGGSSGGSLMIQTDDGFQLIGTLTWGYRGDEGASYWTPISEIREFIDQNKAA
jgi:hypothetical protein